MKKFTIKKMCLSIVAPLLLTSAMSYAQITSPAPYCAAGYDDASILVPHYISNVTMGTLNNTTGTTQFPKPHYAYYNALTIPNYTLGSSYGLSVTHDGGGTIHFVAAYIDYNQDGDFADAGEMVLNQKIGAITKPSTATVAIPATAKTGTTRMRVMVFEDDNYTFMTAHGTPTPCTADATGFLDWGETEDYNINIVTSVTKPVADFMASALSGTTTTVFNFTDKSTNTPTAWNWTFTPSTVSYTTGSATTANPSVKFTAAGTYSVKLVATNAAGKDSITKNAYIKITTTGINEFSSNELIAFSPNPAGDFLHINESFLGADIKIIDMQGRVINEYFAITDKTINVINVPSGIYFIKIIKGSLVLTQKLLIQK